MDLSAPVTYNGLTLQPATAVGGGGVRAGVEINDIDVSPVATDAYYDGTANQDGTDTSDIFARSRTISIQGAVYGTSKGQLFDKLQSVSAAFHPVIAYNADSANLGLLPLKFRQPTIDTTTWTAGYIPMQFNVRPTAPPAYRLNRMRTADDGRGVSVPFSVNLIAVDPAKYHQSQVSQSLTTTSTVITYRGDLYSWPIVTFSLSANGSSAFIIRTPTMSVSINLSSASHVNPTMRDWLLDTRTRTLVQGATAWSLAHNHYLVRNDLLAIDSTFGVIDTGDYAYVGAPTGMSGAISLKYYEAWA